MKKAPLVLFAISAILLIPLLFARGAVRNFIENLRRPSLPTAQPVSSFGAPVSSAPASPMKSPQKNSPNPTATAVNLAVPFGSQAPHADWRFPYQEACEEAAAIMMHYYFAEKKLDADTMDAEILKLVEWEEKTFGYYKDTDAEETARILREYFGHANVQVLYDISLSDIKAEVARGKPVLLLAAGRLLGNPNFRSPGPLFHAVVAKGYTKDFIITNDPGTRKGADYLYDPDVLMNALHDWNGGDVTSGRRVMIVVGQ